MLMILNFSIPSLPEISLLTLYSSKTLCLMSLTGCLPICSHSTIPKLNFLSLVYLNHLKNYPILSFKCHLALLSLLYHLLAIFELSLTHLWVCLNTSLPSQNLASFTFVIFVAHAIHLIFT